MSTGISLADLLNEYSFSIILPLAFGLSGLSCEREPDRQECLSYQLMRIEKAAVLGAGTMGAQIAAHLANAGVPTLLLDIAPRELTPEEQAKGLTVEAREVRNRIAQAGFDAAKKTKPSAFFTADAASLVSVGNFDDDLDKLK